jgi:hypothetical protein
MKRKRILKVIPKEDRIQDPLRRLAELLVENRKLEERLKELEKELYVIK